MNDLDELCIILIGPKFSWFGELLLYGYWAFSLLSYG